MKQYKVNTNYKPMLDIVISRTDDNDFKEIVDVLESSQIFIYDKSDEGETYLSHIIDNYDTLGNYTMFIRNDIYACVASTEHLKETTMHIINTNQPTHFYIPIHGKSEYKQLMIAYGYTNVFDNYYNDIAKRRYEKSSDIRTKKIDKFVIKNTCKELGIDMPKYYTSCQFASFLLKKDAIHQRPKEFYIKAREWLIKNEMHTEVLQLLWPLFFIDECNLEYSSKILELSYSTKAFV